MSELQNRRYKEATPEETVKRIKKILNEIGIEVEERWSKKSSVGTYSLRVCIKGSDIGQNGKGMTKEFAMASGYAEFMERLQNGVFRFRIEKPTEELPFSNSPDEKKLTVEELMKENNSVLEHILQVNGYENKTKDEKIKYVKEMLNENTGLVEKINRLSVPYYSVKYNNLQYMPDILFNYVFATNGMCAGNSPEEALIEGISEVLERYVSFRILKERLVLPEIPEGYIEKFPKVKAMVEKLKKSDEYYFKLVDCSLGGKYPVAGLYILQKNTGKFGFKMGAHPDYGIAMERCFTEAAQGRDIYEYAQTCLFDFYEQDKKESVNLTKFVFSDLAAVPYQVLGQKSNYEFTAMPDVSELDNKSILKKLVDGILQEDKDILIRDLSVLGFPTYSIAIPGMSELSFDPKCNYLKLICTLEELLKDFSKINLSNVSEVIHIMETIINEIGYEQLAYFISLKDISILPCEQIGMGGKYFLSILYIMNKQYKQAAKLLEDMNFMAENLIQNPIEKIMVKAVYYYASAMDKLQNHEKAMYYIQLLFDEQIADAIDMSFKERENILLNHYGITEDDYVDNDDSYYLPFMDKFRHMQKENVIDQMENKKIFE